MSVIAETKYGSVRGVKTTSALGTEYISFFSIPYGTPPVGELRFKDPIPPTKWTEVYDATEQKPSCFSMDSQLKKVVGSEDCLRLNIYTKDLQPNKLHPVMFYLFGGGFNSGSSSTALYGSDFLLMSDVIVVICDYRVGPFGFTYFRDPSLNVPGNAGLKDQLLALKFVKNNIQNFGGDPNNVTLFGHSSGATAVNLHCISEQSKGLFNRAILLSGSVFMSDTASSLEFKNCPLRLAKNLGYTGGDEDRDVYTFLQLAWLNSKPYVTDKTFISKSALELSRMAWANDIDIFIGGTSHEGFSYFIFFDRDPTFLGKLDLDKAIPSELNLQDKNKRLEFVRRMRDVYYGSSEPTENKTAFCEWIGDLLFRHNITRFIECRQNSNGKGKTYFFRFAVDLPTMNNFRLARNRPNIRGALHADEVSYYFKHSFGPIPDRQSMEFTAVQRFVSLMTSFATTGNPNDNILNVDLQNVEWNPVNTKKPPFKLLNFDEDLEFKIQPEADRLLFWDSLYAETNTPLY